MSDKEISPLIPVDNRKFLCVEYPGYVKNTQRAITTLGGEKALVDALANDRTVTVNYRSSDTFSHPINGYVLPSSKLLVKVTRRVKKNKTTGEVEAEDPDTPWKTEILGIIPKTVRFRALADFQYQVPKDDRIRLLKESLHAGNVDKIVDFKIATDDDDFNNIRGIPPPVFTNHETTFAYGYRQNSNVIRVRVKQPDGSFKVKLINRNRNAGPQVTVVHFDEENIPSRSWYNIQPSKEKEEDEVIEIVRKLFEERPIWTRIGVKSNLDPKYHKFMKQALITSAYTFQSGPWRECWVKYGLDPRKDQKYNIYQQVDIRKSFSLRTRAHFIKARKYKPVMTVTRSEREKQPGKIPVHHNNLHIFDGQTISRETSVFQLCDIIDPDLTPLINKAQYMKKEATRYSGFYYRCVLNRIRTGARNKFLRLDVNEKPDPIHNIERGIMDEIAKEIESNKRAMEEEEEGSDMEEESDVTTSTANAERAIRDAMEASKKPDNMRLKDVVDEYMVQLQKVIKSGKPTDDDDDELDLDVIDGLEDYDEEFDIEDEEEEETTANDDTGVNNTQEEDVEMEEAQ